MLENGSDLAQIVCALILVSVVVLILRFNVRPVTALSLGGILCVALGMVPIEEAVAKLTQPAVVAIVVILLITGILAQGPFLSRALSRIVGNGGWLGRLRLFLGVALISSILSNTAVVATVLRSWRQGREPFPSSWLLPVSYSAVLGGTLTLVGTSTNLLVEALWVDAEGQHLQLLDFLPVGLLALACCLPLLLIMHAWLPQRPSRTSREIWCVEMEVSGGSSLVGKTVEGAGLRHIGSHYLVRILRSGEKLEPISPEAVLREGDLLHFVGDRLNLQALTDIQGLQLHAGEFKLEGGKLSEVVVQRNSPLVDRTLKDVGFRQRFHAAVVAIARGSGSVETGLGEIPLHPGDVLSLMSEPGDRTVGGENHWFRILSESEEPIAFQKGRRRTQLLLWVAFISALGAVALGWISLLAGVLSVLILGLGMSLTNLETLRTQLPVDLAIALASGLILAHAMHSSGLDLRIAQGIFSIIPDHPVIALAVIFFVTLLITEMVTNAAAAAVVFPIALQASHLLEIAALPLVLAVAYGASGSFMTPHGYQTNLLVQTPGGYSAHHYLRVGFPMAIIYSLACLSGLSYLHVLSAS